MFDHSDKPRVFGMPPGADFATTLVAGLQEFDANATPMDWARVEVYVNTNRMQRRASARCLIPALRGYCRVCALSPILPVIR